MAVKLIAFNGQMGVGKSTAIAILNNLSNIKLVKFAAPLYNIQEYIYDVISPVYERPSDFIKDRKLLQWLGTNWGRDTISNTLWVDMWKQEVENRLSKKQDDLIIVCDDCRFDNEAEVVKSLGGIIVKITSNKTDQRIDTKAGLNNHASEAGISEKYIDYTIENNDTLESYRKSLCNLYNELLK